MMLRLSCDYLAVIKKSGGEYPAAFIRPDRVENGISASRQ
jgi:hypothetical protein